MICNAVCHRSYLEPACVQVAFYDNRLEVTSPGMLVGGVTLAKMREGYSKVRNKGIAAAFAYMKIIERWGSGIPRMYEDCKDYGLPEPDLIDLDGDFRVNLYRIPLEKIQTVDGMAAGDERKLDDGVIDEVTNGENVVENIDGTAEKQKNVVETIKNIVEKDKNNVEKRKNDVEIDGDGVEIEKNVVEKDENVVEKDENVVENYENVVEGDNNNIAEEMKSEEDLIKEKQSFSHEIEKLLSGYSRKRAVAALQLLKTISSNETITISEMAKKVELSERSVQRYLREFQNAGVLKRQGSDTSGVWILQ